MSSTNFNFLYLSSAMEVSGVVSETKSKENVANIEEKEESWLWLPPSLKERQQ